MSRQQTGETRQPEVQNEGPSLVAGVKHVACEAASQIRSGATATRDWATGQGERQAEQKEEEKGWPVKVEAKIGEVGESARRVGAQAKECAMGPGEEKAKNPDEKDWRERAEELGAAFERGAEDLVQGAKGKVFGESHDREHVKRED
eukprot:CAMPEP_0204278304 /NCGR_PEP_ID=MMETSP0468-20130131/29788_1 /ASSEMBLY_ACC=CAM_ASM_000383 /TAXON_ID=2969 /ORGANISM="Oxyrrhis marina" /LENGTH=146 /DNA_ID=CAMNT_0051255189 /DNA_START=32 /DNA_END=472 /DNA_ORIENTATION=+